MEVGEICRRKNVTSEEKNVRLKNETVRQRALLSSLHCLPSSRSSSRRSSTLGSSARTLLLELDIEIVAARAAADAGPLRSSVSDDHWSVTSSLESCCSEVPNGGGSSDDEVCWRSRVGRSGEA